MPTPALLLVIATLLPLVSFLTLVFVGKRMGNPIAGWVGTLAIGLSFAASVAATISWINGGSAHGVEWGQGTQPIVLRYQWIPVGDNHAPAGSVIANQGFLDVGIYLDSLTVLMFGMVT